VCTTAAVPQPSVLPISIHFDRIVRMVNTSFEFTENPTITKISPSTSFVGGGRTITVTGTNFHSVQHPVLHLSNGLEHHSTECYVKDNTFLHCLTPALHSHHRTKRSGSLLEYTISFTMDGVESVQNLPLHFPTVNSTLTAFPNPVYTVFENGLKVYKGEALILMGNNLNTACRLDEVTVWIGNTTCKVNSIDSTTLYCSPPAVQPAGPQDDHRVLPLVTVVVGNLVYELGRLKYQKMDITQSEDQWIIFSVVAACGGTLLTLIIITVAVYKRKSTLAEHQFTKLQVQLDALESNIRHECKQAFAELQTEVIDFTSDLNVIGIPFWDHRTYTFKVLFPSFSDHPILLHNSRKANTPNGFEGYLDVFYQLLNIDQFLLIFIQTLDEQKTFGIRDKSMVASLLMVIFRDKMEYATEIIKVLLDDLITKCVERKTPKLMLRRVSSREVINKLALTVHVPLPQDTCQQATLYALQSNQASDGKRTNRCGHS
jgi:plexin A